MQTILSSMAVLYGLTRTEVISEIEVLFSIVLSQWYRVEVMVFFREELRLEAVAYNKAGGIITQRLVDLPAIMSRNTLKQYLEEHLAKSSVLKLVRRYKSFEKELLWGEVTGCDHEHNLYVETEIIPGERIIAVCPLNRIGLHERQGRRFDIGQRRAFHLRRVEPVSLNGTPRLKVVLDRVSKTLVETLLKDQSRPESDRIKLRCVKRYVGHKSIVLTTRRLPREAIIAVDRELRERVQVQIVKNLP